MIDVGERIRSWRQVRGLSQKALAVRVGTAGNMIGVYERGESSPTIHQLQRISEALRLSVHELLAGPPPTRMRPSSGMPIPSADLANETICPIPYSEGWRGESLAGPEVVLWPIPRALLPHEGCLVTRVPDDAMHPYLLRGDAVIVDPDCQRPRSGSLVLLEAGERHHVRRFLILKRRRTFEAFNPLFPSLEPAPELRVLGRIVALIERNLRDGAGLRMGWAPFSKP